MRRIIPIAAALAFALLLCMIWYSWQVLVPSAGGLLPFDARPFGYDPEEALAYLRQLDSSGRAVYLLEMHWLDTAFPPVAALAAGLGIVVATRGRRRGLRLLMLVPVLAYLGADLAENATVQEMLRRNAENFSPRLAEWASLFTRLKFAFLLVTALVLAGLGRRRSDDG